jgi:myo-inositol 2-dehydrogenase/D-chiro-inositol 1-dehydrogenase
MPDPGNTIRLGIVGCGLAARAQQLPTLSALPEFTVAAIADTDVARCSELADRFSIPLQFSSHRDLLTGTDVDAVVVATPPTSHAEIGLDVLRAGKHMFMEKPLAMNLEECDRLIDAAAQSQVKVVVGFNSRWHRLAVRAREVVRSGLLGPLKAIRSVYTHAHDGPTAQYWHKTRALGGGVMFNDGVHHFDLWRYLLDSEVVQVQADSINSAHFEDDTCTVSARLANGALASAVFSFSTSSNSELEIFGESGSLLLSLYRFDGLVFSPSAELPGSIKTRSHQVMNFLRYLPAGVAALRRGGDFDTTYTAMWSHYADCILKGATPACTLSDGRAATAVVLACFDSISSGCAVALS